jgi:hypothetical protein
MATSLQGETLADNIKNVQKINGTGNQQAGESIYNISQTFSENAAAITLDVKIFQDIFDHALSLRQGRRATNRDRTHLNTPAKIVLNFSDERDQEYVRTCYRQGLQHIEALEPYYRALDSEQQLDIESNILDAYQELRLRDLQSCEILIELFRHYTPREKVDDPSYQRIAKAFVLMFFEDCTIFEKTKQELDKTSVTT